MSTIASRQKAVEQANANFALEDMYPDATDRALQRGYITGTVSIEDLLQNARQYAAEVHAKIKRQPDAGSPHTPVPE